MPKWRNFTQRRLIKWPMPGQVGYRPASMTPDMERRNYKRIYCRISSTRLAEAVESFRNRTGAFSWIIREMCTSQADASYYCNDYAPPVNGDGDDRDGMEYWQDHPFTEAELPKIWE